ERSSRAGGFFSYDNDLRKTIEIYMSRGYLFLFLNRMRWNIKVDSRKGADKPCRSEFRTRRKGSCPVSPVLLNSLRHSGIHSSGPAVACRLEQPTRGQRE